MHFLLVVTATLVSIFAHGAKSTKLCKDAVSEKNPISHFEESLEVLPKFSLTKVLDENQKLKQQFTQVLESTDKSIGWDQVPTRSKELLLAGINSLFQFYIEENESLSPRQIDLRAHKFKESRKKLIRWMLEQLTKISIANGEELRLTDRDLENYISEYVNVFQYFSLRLKSKEEPAKEREKKREQKNRNQVFVTYGKQGVEVFLEEVDSEYTLPLAPAPQKLGSFASRAIYSSDGKYFLWKTKNTIDLWEKQKNAPHRNISMGSFSELIAGAKLRQHGKVLSWPLVEGDIYVWEVDQRGKPSYKRLKENHDSQVVDAIFTPEGNILAGFKNGKVLFWEEKENNEYAEAEVFENHGTWVLGVMVSPEGDIISWSLDGKLVVRRKNKQGIYEPIFLEEHKNSIYHVLPLSDGRFLSLSSDKSLRMWKRKKGRSYGTKALKGHQFTPDGAIELAPGSYLTWSILEIFLWKEGANGKMSFTALEGVKGEIRNLLVTAEGHILVSAKRKFMFWKKQGDGSYSLVPLGEHAETITHIFDLGAGRALSLSKDKTIKVWSLSGEERPVETYEFSEEQGDLLPVTNEGGEAIQIKGYPVLKFSEGEDFLFPSFVDLEQLP